MSLDKAVEHGKELRKKYRGSKRFDCTCRNHGACPYCVDDRTKKNNEKRKIADEKIREVASNVV